MYILIRILYYSRSAQTASAKRRDDHTHVSVGTNGTPGYSEDRCIERAAKKVNIMIRYHRGFTIS